jgi:CubicO group peptidase (beta-lactamase class C family)
MPMPTPSALLVATVGADGTVVHGGASAIVPWWSFGKTLLAACVLRLAEAGRVALDEPPSILVGVPEPGGHGRGGNGPTPPWTVRQLLQHTAGIRDYGPLPAYRKAVAAGEQPWPDAALYRRVPPTDLCFAPGNGWSYSNVGYLLLRRLVERVLECDLGEALALLVLQPLELRDCRVAMAAGDLSQLALEVPTGYHPGWVYHGLVIGPVDQAALALHRLWHGDLLSPATRVTMATAVPVGGPIAGRPWVSHSYGLGLMVGGMAEDGAEAAFEVLGHSAGGPGSAGAVYTALSGRPATVAAFTAGENGGPAEFAALRAIRRLRSGSDQLAT